MNLSDPKTIIIAVYLALVGLIGLLSLVAIAVLNKNAEKPSTAKVVGISYAIAFTVIFIISIRSISNL